jgi:hypothetical protein
VGGPVGQRRRPEPAGGWRRRRQAGRGGEDQGGGGERAEEGEGGHGAGVPVDQGQVPAEERRQEAGLRRGRRVLTLTMDHPARMALGCFENLLAVDW